MDYIGWGAGIRPERLEDYVTAHAAVTPAMQAAISSAGYQNSHMFLMGNLVFGYAEAEDRQAAEAALSRSPANVEWQARMSELFILDQQPRPIREIFWLP